MGKVITVWGSPGSGKSMFCCILAKALTRDKRKAIIINADMNVPMLPVWLPEQIIQTNTSIGQVLSSVEIDTSLIASHVTVLKNYPFIGMMGYAAGENPLSYPEVKYTMVLQLIHAAAKLVDFVILDCSTSMTNVFTPAAIEAGDVVIRILTPDLKGINYLKAHQPLLVDERFRFSEHMTFAGLARPFHALDEMGYIIGGFDGLLPYSKEIDRCATEGGIFLTDGRCSVYPARTRTCRIYPLTVGPGERGRDFEYCLCLDRHRSHFTSSRVSIKDWLYQNFKREDKDYVKREYEIATELGKLMRAIDPAMRQGIVFKVLYYRYYNFDLDQPFQPQYEQNNRHLLADLHRIAREQ